MKKWLVLLLLIITSAGTIIPCCDIDDCCVDQFENSPNHEKNQSEGSCSPFFACGTCAGFVELSKLIYLIQSVPEKQVHHEQVTRFHLTTYAASYWQPPRYC